MPTRYLIEVAAETPADAAAAESGGADRVELSSALDLGGLTPTVGLFAEAKAATRLPVWAMIRPRPGDFVYDESDVRAMAADMAALLPISPAGFVFGVLRENGTVDGDACSELIAAAGGKPCVFHRAFDRCPDPAAALEEVIKLGFRRVLTSGRETTAVAGLNALRDLVKLADGRIEILPCGRIRSGNAELIVREMGCDQIHASFSEPIPGGPGLGRRGYPGRSRVSQTDLAETRRRLDELAAGPPRA